MTLQEQIRANRLRTAWLLLLFALLVAGLGLLLGLVYEPTLLTVVAVAGLAYGVLGWIFSGSMVAAMTGARPVDRRSHPELYKLVETVAIGAGLERTPEVRIVDDPAPNAFAAGRSPDKAFVAVTSGLLELMGRRELEGVLAHEVAHIRNRDVRLMSLAAVLVGVIAFVADILLRLTYYGAGGRRDRSHPIFLVLSLVALLLAPVAALLIQLALSRRREYLADASAAEITGDAEGLARALRKLLLDQREIRNASRATAHLYIESPLRQASGVRAGLRGLFDTHPPLEDRIAALERLGGFRLPPA